jgi:hypothetical protein
MNRCLPIVAASTVLLAVLAARLPADEGSNAGVQARGETRISLTKLADEVASRIIASTPLAQSGLDRRIKAEFVEIVTTYGPSQPSPQYIRVLLTGLDAYLKKSFPEGAQTDDPVRRDEAYLNLIPEIRNLQWKLCLAVGRRPLADEALTLRDEQQEWMRDHIRSLPYPAFLTRLPKRDDDIYKKTLADFDAKIADALCPSFKEPLNEQAFERLQERLAAYNPEDELLYVVPHLVWEESRLTFGNAASPLLRLETFQEKPVSVGQANGNLSAEFHSSAASLGIRNRIDSFRNSNGSLIDLSEATPGMRAIIIPRDSKPSMPPTMAELDKLYTAQGSGHVVFDDKELRLVGCAGTKLAPLKVRRWIEVDRVQRREILHLVKEQGSPTWVLPEPVEKDIFGRLRYDALAAVLTSAGRLFIIQPQEFAHGSFAFRIREHDPLRLGQGDGDRSDNE